MNLELTQRKYLITGGSAGLGLAAAQSLVAEGADVAICGRDEDRLNAAVSNLRASGTDVVGIKADVTKPNSFIEMREQIASRWGVLDGLVNNAGTHTSGTFESASDATWYQDFDLKVMAMLRGVRDLLPLLRKSGHASVLNVLSIYAKYQYRGSMPSSLFRSAGLSATNTLAMDLADNGIRVNAALIGFIHSDQQIRAAGTDEPAEVAAFEDRRAAELKVPLGRAGRPEEFGDLAAFLLSPRAGYITGTSLNVDGGLSPVI